jgi:hypothetical protein
MGEIKKILPEKLVIGFIYKNEEIVEKVKDALINEFGKIDFESAALNFIHTDYYNKEIGENLLKKFISFEKLVNPDKLFDIKIFTNSIEQKFLYNGTNNRMINIDPGLLSLSKLVLATTKNYDHRIYIGKGIFAEVTLRWTQKNFKEFEWTYPDFRTEEYKRILGKIREIYKEQIKLQNFDSDF